MACSSGGATTHGACEEETVDTQFEKIEQKEGELREVLSVIERELSEARAEEQEQAAESQTVVAQLERIQREL